MQNQKPKLSCIMIACDGIEVTKPAIFSLRNTVTNPCEIILVDNYSQDGTGDWAKLQPDVKVVRSDKLIGYGEAINLGVQNASPDSKYLALLNNDLLFTNGWDQKLIDIIEHPEWIKENVDRIGIAGPVSNHAAGLQLLKMQRFPLEHLEIMGKRIEQETRKKGMTKYVKAGWLQGFCLMVSRECFEQVGGMDTFPPTHHGFEDNDFVLRAEIEGYSSIICFNTLIFHHGQWTEKNMNAREVLRGGLATREGFFNKWKNIIKHNKDGKTPKPEKMKLVAGYRVKNCGEWFDRVLTKMSEIADEIIIFDDNSTDDTIEIAEKFPKVVLIHKQTEKDFKEDRDRETLLQLCKSRDPDWIIITDGDEELCDKCTRESFDMLMNPINPMTTGYYFRSFTFWDSYETIRSDGNFGVSLKVPLFRNLPNQHIANMKDQPQGFHCNSMPPMSGGINLLPTIYKLLHYGYVDPKERRNKYDFYMEKDTKKDPSLIGNVDYRHLIDINVDLVKYNPETSCSFTTIVKNEGHQLHDFISHYHLLFDEMIFVDTGSGDNSRKIIEYYKDYGVRLIDFKWIGDFSAARNVGLRECKSTHIYTMDLDERFGEYTQPFKRDKFWIHRLIEQPNLAYLVPKHNYYLDNSVDNVVSNPRLFRNLPEIEFKGLVHETITKSLEKLSGKGYGGIVHLSEKNPLLYHTNFMQDPIKLSKKLSYYTSLMRTQLARDPNDAFMHMSMALHYENEGNKELTAYHFNQAKIHEPRSEENWQSLIVFELRCVRETIEEALQYIRPESPYGQNILYLYNMLKTVAGPSPMIGMPGRMTGNIEEGQ